MLFLLVIKIIIVAILVDKNIPSVHCSQLKINSNHNEHNDRDNDSRLQMNGTGSSDHSITFSATNGTQDYDYMNADVGEEETEEELESDEQSNSFLQKLRQMHSEGRNLSVITSAKHINETIQSLNSFQRQLQHLLPTDGRLGLEFMEFLSEIDLQLSRQCSTALFKVLAAIRKSEIWALKFPDSMGRYPPLSFAEGVQSSFGDFDECLSIKSPISEDIAQPIDGKYCLLNAKLPFPSTTSYRAGEPLLESNDEFQTKLMNYYGLEKVSSVKSMIEYLNLSNGTIYSFGLCIPSVCTAEEIEDTLNKILYPIIRLPLEVNRNCRTRDEAIKLDKFQVSSISILTSLMVIVLISTGIELFRNRRLECQSAETDSMENIAADNGRTDNKNPSKCLDVLLSFSLIGNVRQLFARNENFAALDTIRLLMIVHIHFGHIYQFVTSVGSVAVRRLFSDVMHKVFEDNEMVFARSPLPVDALFALSGFLLSYGLLRRLDKTNGRFNYLLFIFQRYIRFAVLVFGSILFFYVYPLTGDGPIWDSGVRRITDQCENPQNLLKNLLFINNFNDKSNTFAENKCHPMTWFLSALLHLTIIAPAFVIVIFKRPVLGTCTLIVGIIIGAFLTVSPYILFGIRPYLQIWDLDTGLFFNSRSFSYYHTSTPVYLMGFLVGIGFGCLLHYKRNVSLGRALESVLWLLSIGSVVGVYLWQNAFWRLDHSAPLISALLWHSVGKLAFSLGISWILFACCTGRAGLLNTVLSWQALQPLARLSFGIYLLHNLVIGHRVFGVKDTYVMSAKYMLEHTIVDLIYDSILAFVFYVLIERPFSNIFEAIFRPKQPKKQHLNEKNSFKTVIKV